MHKEEPITKIYTGGQTGVDQAGVIAALALSIPVEVNMPIGFKRRSEFGNYTSSITGLLDEYQEQVDQLKAYNG